MNANVPAAHFLRGDSFAKPDFVEPDIVRRFLAWAQRAGPEDRAEAASALARAYLHSGLTPPMRVEAALAMTALLDDPSPLVRRALAEALASASEAPRHVVLALASDQSDVAAAVLQRSPLLTDADLVDCAAIADVVAQSAVARRPNLSLGAAAALAEIGEREAILTLIGNRGANLPARLLNAMFARFSDEADVREALVQRGSLPAALKAKIAVATAKDLSAGVTQWVTRERSERIAREARDQTICSIASACRGDERKDLVRALRECGALTPALLLRSLLGGERDLFADALAELSGLPAARVAAFIFNPSGQGFAALALKAGLKARILPVFRAALAAIKTHPREEGEGLKPALVRSVIADCEARNDPALGRALALLWRFAAEAARAEAAGFVREAKAYAEAPRLPPRLDFVPANDSGGAPKETPDFEPLRPYPPRLEFKPTLEAPSEDSAPRVELPIDLIAALDDAA